jgi:hypothetical protein
MPPRTKRQPGVSEETEYPPVVSQEIPSRCCTDRMVTSHVTMALPCAWWVFTEFSSTYNEQLMDRIMAIIMTVAVALSVLYHLYHERVLCDAEKTYLLGATALLNVYMWVKGISVLSIAMGLPLLGVLQHVLTTSRASKRVYDERHHLCHHISGVYIAYCVFLIRTRAGATSLPAGHADISSAGLTAAREAVKSLASTDIAPPFPDVVVRMLNTVDKTFLATTVDSSPHLSLMKFTYHQPDEVIILSTQRGTKKFHHIQTNPKVRLRRTHPPRCTHTARALQHCTCTAHSLHTLTAHTRCPPTTRAAPKGGTALPRLPALHLQRPRFFVFGDSQRRGGGCLGSQRALLPGPPPERQRRV